MKVEQRQSEFRPVLITLESEEEVAKLVVVLGRTVDSDSNFLSDLYRHLEGIVNYGDNPFQVLVTATNALRIVRK